MQGSRLVDFRDCLPPSEVDVVAYDTTGDGKADQVMQDTNHDGKSRKHHGE